MYIDNRQRRRLLVVAFKHFSCAFAALADAIGDSPPPPPPRQIDGPGN